MQRSRTDKTVIIESIGATYTCDLLNPEESAATHMECSNLPVLVLRLQVLIRGGQLVKNSENYGNPEKPIPGRVFRKKIMGFLRNAFLVVCLGSLLTDIAVFKFSSMLVSS